MTIQNKIIRNCHIKINILFNRLCVLKKISQQVFCLFVCVFACLFVLPLFCFLVRWLSLCPRRLRKREATTPDTVLPYSIKIKNKNPFDFFVELLSKDAILVQLQMIVHDEF